MNNSKGLLLNIFSALTTFLWCYALGNFIILSITGNEFALIFAGTFFFASLIITRAALGSGRRLITITLLHITVFIFFMFIFIHSFFKIGSPVFHLFWIKDFFLIPRDFSGWFNIVLIFILPTFFWIAGTQNAVKDNDYRRNCGKLDLGAAFFFVIFLIKFMLRTRSDIIIEDPKTIKLFYAFFILALGSVALSKNKGDADKYFLARHQGTGVILLVSLISLSLLSAILLLLLPELSSAAASGYKLMGRAAGPVKNILIFILDSLFGLKKNTPAVSAGNTDGSFDMSILSDAAEKYSLIGLILGHIMLSILILAAVLAVGTLLWLTIKKLLGKTQRTEQPWHNPSLFEIFVIILKSIKNAFRSFYSWISVTFSGQKTVEELYGSLLKWGEAGGIPRYANETPVEYQHRLSDIFSFAAAEVDFITNIFIRKFYAFTEPEPDSIIAGTKHLKRIRNPKFIFLRLKGWIGR